MRYTAFINKAYDTDYGVSFPDLPGCIAVGETIEQALESAAEALAFHIDGMEEDGDTLPPPRPLDAILSDVALTEDRKGALLASVPLIRDLGSTTRVNISIDYGLLHALDSEAKLRKQTRSAFIASAVRKEIQNA